MKLHLDCKKALGELSLRLTPDPIAYCLALSALGKGLA